MVHRTKVVESAMSDGKKKVVLVGHCGPDSYALRSAVGAAAPGVEVVFANDDQELAKVEGSASLLLVNRVLDGDFADTSGMSLIGRLAARGARVMLVSNFPEAQAEAEKAGALPGFGKKTMYAAETKVRIERALAGG